MGNIFTRRNVLGTLFIVFAVTLCTTTVAFGMFRECVTTYTNVMPIPEDAELVESESSFLNYFGLGTLQTVWFVAADSTEVTQWYNLALGEMRRAEREAQRNGEKPPPIWNGDWVIVPVDGGSQVQMQSRCF
jgi:hypothetical protein